MPYACKYDVQNTHLFYNDDNNNSIGKKNYGYDIILKNIYCMEMREIPIGT